MPPPAMDEDLLLSLSPLSERKDPDDEVRETVHSLLDSTYLNPIVEKFLEDPRQKDLFLEVFARQANLIKSRCQSFDDGHVTVYDKVLLKLTENGNIFDSVAAQEYFCEEFLGISKDGSPFVAEQILQQNVVLKAILAQAAYPEGEYGEKYSAQTKYGDKGQHRPSVSTAPTKEDDMDAKITRLTSIYEKAKLDFETVPAGDTIRKLEAARFLRDTAENTVMYFRDPAKSGNTQAANPDMEELIADLEATCKTAQASVVHLSGGRKRKFDKHDYEVVPRSARGNGKSNRRGSAYRGAGGRPAKKWHDAKRDVRRRSSVEISPQHPHSVRDQQTAHQRAFGYFRPVDSYQPGDEAAPGVSHAHPYEQHPHDRYHGPSESARYSYEGGALHHHQEREDTSSRYGYGEEQGWGHGRDYGHGSYEHGRGHHQEYDRREEERGRRGYSYSRRGTGRRGGEYQPELGY